MASKARLRLVERREPADDREGLAPEWQTLPGGSLMGLPWGGRAPGRRIALLHSRRGIAILDVLAGQAASVSPDEAAATVVALQARLGAADFPRVFPGHLPMVHLALPEAALPSLARRLEEAFAAIPPLSLPPGDAWTGPARRALTAAHGSAPRPVPPMRRAVTLRWRLAGGVCLGLAGLGVVAAVLAPGRDADHAAASPLRPHMVITSAATGLAGDAGSDPVEPPPDVGDSLAAFDRALAALKQSYGDEAPPVVLASAGATQETLMVLVPDQEPEALPVVESVPEPEEARLPDLVAEAPRVVEAVPEGARPQELMAEAPSVMEAVPEPEEARLPDLAAEAPRVAEAVPEPEEARLPDLAAVTPRVAEAMPEPEEARLPDPAAVALRVVEAVPEQEEAQRPDLAAVAPPAVEPIPDPEEARLLDLVAEAPRVAESVPEPEEVRLPDLAAVAPPAVEPIPEPEEARLPDLAAVAPRVAEPAPEPEEVRLPDLAADAPHVAERVEPVPEPEEARLPDLAADAPRVAERVAPLPEPEEARLPDLAAEAPRVAERVEPVQEEARLPAVAAQAPRVVEPATVPRQHVATLDSRLVNALLSRGQAMMAQGDISGARLLFARAAQAGSAEAATAMARSFDGAVLAGMGARGIRPDAAQAEHWYRRAAELGAGR